MTLLTLPVLLLAVWQWRLLVHWWEHDLQGTTQIGPFSVRDWARIGKVAQFVAGLTVVLDVIGPERILAVGAEIRKYRQNVLDAMSDLKGSHHVAAQSSELFRSLIETRGEGDGSYLWHFELAGHGPPRAVLPSLAQDSLEEWHKAAAERLGRSHTCDVSHESSAYACDWQVAVAQEEADRYLEESVPGLISEDLADLRERVSAAYLKMAAGSLVANVVIALAIEVVLSETVSASLAWLLTFGYVTGAVLLFGILAVTFRERPPTSQWGTLPLRFYLWVLTAPAAYLLQKCGAALGRYHEGQMVKLAALGVFGLGWLLDFLAA
ncbi:hypothetical protein [Actinoplanes sp. NPDC049599]|uniref:hypothetical protein n=1 Tax=Actinoplanes sp. NPDC049599 TaxID=3363903 RepID=UPI00379216FB